MGTRKYVVSKILQALLTLVFVLVFNFFLFRIVPGNPAELLLRGHSISTAGVRALEKQLGLNQPIPQQFVTYVTQTLQGHLGISYFNSQPVVANIGQRVWPTVLLVGSSTIASTIIGLLIGIYGGWRRGSAFDLSTLGFSLVTYAMPEYWLGIMLLVVFVAYLPLFPAGGMSSALQGQSSLQYAADVLNHLFLPFITLTVAYLGEYALIMRSALLDTLGEDYITTARAKGVREKFVLRKHAVPNALLPTMTLTILNIGFVISGAITIETVFSWPGLGLLTFQAIGSKDYPLLQGLFLLFSAAVIVANLVADLLYSYLDPRVRAA